jgi:altronate dehydratase small subunit
MDYVNDSSPPKVAGNMVDSDPPQEDDPRLLRISPEDNVAVATAAIEAGESVIVGRSRVTFPQRIPTGHKVALVAIAAGQKVLKYGAAIGSATRDIRPGDHVHVHNLKSDYLPTYTLDRTPGDSQDH